MLTNSVQGNLQCEGTYATRYTVGIYGLKGLIAGTLLIGSFQDSALGIEIKIKSFLRFYWKKQVHCKCIMLNDWIHGNLDCHQTGAYV